jgi:1D-myo-inositol-tetrakisphosphate 5-kinase/inositol-polyphosphate multikinase
MSFQGDEPPKPMVGQVGGVSGDKRRLLSIPPDYVLKPVNEKEYRGLREVAFYEAIKMAFSHTSSQFAIAGLDGKDTATDTAYSAVISEHVEMLAMWLAIVLHDQDVVSSETVLLASWRELRREMDLLRRLSQFTAEYYGVCSLTPQGNHILLQDLTASFYKPCVMDLKMGTQSFEPDASAEKRQKEISKYPQQAEFGLRIVGIRKYAPKHSEADHDGYLYRGKMYGRALSTREQIQQEMVNFFLDPDSGEIRRQTVSKVIISLKLLRKWFDDNKRFRFYSSSILIIFEGMTRREDSAKVRMVDFGHVRRQLGGDESYRLGLTTLTNILTELLTENDSLT